MPALVGLTTHRRPPRDKRIELCTTRLESRPEAGPHPRQLHPIGLIRRRGFETAVRLNGDSGYAAADALDAAGGTLGSSRTIPL